MADEEHEQPTPTQAELNAINRKIFGHGEPGIGDDFGANPEAVEGAGGEDTSKGTKIESVDLKSAEGEKPASYKTRQAKAD